MKRFLALLLVSIGFSARATIRESKSIQEIVPYVNAQTLWVFDLDNTVIMPAQMLGGEEWFDYRVTEHEKALAKTGVKSPELREAANRKAIAEFNLIQEVTQVLPVEKEAPAAIAKAQSQGAKVMALTARSVSVAEATQRQLKSVGIDFSNESPSLKSITVQDVNPAHYLEGVLYVESGNNKGRVLAGFLSAVGLHPKRVVFVDNKRHHLEGMETALSLLGIEYFGFRHGPADAKIARFDPQIADIQMRHFESILSDRAARRLANKR